MTKNDTKLKTETEVLNTRQRITSSMLTVLSTLVAFLGGQFGGGILLLLLLSFIYKPDKIQSLVKTDNIVQGILILLIEAVTVAIIYFFIKLKAKNFREYLKLNGKPKIEHLKTALLTFGFYFLCLVALVVAIDILVPVVDTSRRQQIGFDNFSTASLPVIFATLALAVPITEEILFRGYLFGALEKYAGFLVSAIITSLLFGAAHLELGSGKAPNWIAAADTLLFSGFLIWITKKTGSLYPAIMLHMLKNSLAFLTVFAIPALRS